MRVKSVALLVLALGCGLVASIGITQVMAKRSAKTVVASGETQSIFVALSDIPLGDPLTSQNLRLEHWPKDKILGGALSRTEDVEGRRTRTKLYAGEPILENKLFPKGTGDLGATARIPKGYRVVPVKVDMVSGGSSLILPGDRVDVVVYVTRCPSKNIPESGVHTVLQDIKVFAVNSVVDLEAEGSTEKSIKAQTISLLVTPSQAQKLMLATELGKVRLVMRSPEDDKIADTAAATSQDLFGWSESGNREKESLVKQPNPDEAKTKGFLDFLEQMRAKALAKKSPAPAEPSSRSDSWEMRIVAGAEVKDVLLQMSSTESHTPGGPGFWKLGTAGGNPAPGAKTAAPAAAKAGPAPQPLPPGVETEPDAEPKKDAPPSNSD